jgi:hypothetical protein
LPAVSGPLLSSDDIPECPPWLLWLSGAIPLAYYVATASGHAYWYQDGVLVGTAAELGVAPAPGAPLSSLVASLLTLMPVGPLSFRVSCASACFMALGLVLFARTLFFTLYGLGARRLELNATLSLASVFALGLTPGFWLTATRANVYALSWLLAFAVVDALVRFELSQPSDDLRLLHFAAFLQGLGFANHYGLALLTLPAAAPTLGRVFARRGFIGLMGHAVAPIFGFSAYVYVPIRAGQHPLINFGEANTLTRVFGLLSADATFGPREASGPFSLDVARSFVEGVGSLFWPLLVLALVGLTLAKRAHGLRRFAVIWALYGLLPFVGVALLIGPKLDADRLSALVPSMTGLVALAAIGLALGQEQLRKQGSVTPFLWASRALALSALVGLMASAGTRGLARFEASDAVDDITRRALPEGALLLSQSADTHLRALGAEVEERVRPDLTVLPLTEPNEALRLATERELAPVLRDVIVKNRLSLGSLQSLAGTRPLYLELGPLAAPDLYPTLVSEGLLSRVLPDGATEGDERVAQALLVPRLAQLKQRLSRAPVERDSARRLSEALVAQATQAAALEDGAAALELFALAAFLSPDDESIAALAAAVRTQHAQQQNKK